MKDNDIDACCRRVLKFLGFHLHDEWPKFQRCYSKNGNCIWGMVDELTAMQSFNHSKDSKEILEFVQKSRRFFAVCCAGGEIERFKNPFFNCSLEEMMIYLDLNTPCERM